MANRYLHTQLSGVDSDRDGTKFTYQTGDAFPSVSKDTTNGHSIDVVSEDISTEKGFVYPTTSAQRNKRSRLLGGISVGGEFQVPLYPSHSTSLISYVLGTPLATTTAADDTHSATNRHKMKLEKSVPFFTAFIGKQEQEHQYEGGIAKSCTIDMEVGEAILMSMDCMFRRENIVTSATGIPSPIADATFTPYNNKDQVFSGTDVKTEYAADGSTFASAKFIESASIEINNTVVDDNFVLGKRYIPFGFIQECEISGNMSLSFQPGNKGNYTDFTGEKTPGIKFKMSRGSGAKYREILITIPRASLDTASLPTEGSDRYLLEIEFMADSTSGTTSPINVEVVNELTAKQFYG